MSTDPPPPPPPPVSGTSDIDHDPGGSDLAEVWKRIVARSLDAIIVNVVFGAVVRATILGTNVSLNDTDDLPSGKLLLASIVLIAVGFVWYAVFTKLKGGSPMKLVFGMNVVTTEGRPVTWSHAIKRWGVVAVWSLVPLLSLVVPITMVIVSLVFLFTQPLRTTVWDRFAGTLVIDVAGRTGSGRRR